MLFFCIKWKYQSIIQTQLAVNIYKDNKLCQKTEFKDYFFNSAKHKLQTPSNG